MKKNLIKNLDSSGYPIIELKGSDRGSIFILPFGARVLGLFTRDDIENFFWVNPAFNKVSSAREFFKTKDWKNTGGDRTWVGPEVDLFIKDLKDPSNTYEVPSAVDPGKYTLKRCGKTLRIFNHAKVVLYRLKKELEFEIYKEIHSVPNPLRDMPEAQTLVRQLDYVGYEQRTGLRLLLDVEEDVRIDIWNLIQLPAGGSLLIPTLVNAKPRIYFGEVSKNHIQIKPNFVRLLLDARKRYKIGLKAASLTGRAGYLRQVEKGTWTLLVRNFFVNPSGEYVDVPWDDEKDFGYAFQSYNDDGQYGNFGELEYHTPAIGYGTEVNTYLDQSHVWAFSGRKEYIFKACESLLGCKTD